MIRWLGSAIRVCRHFSLQNPLLSSDRVSLVHSRTPQQALDELLKMQTRDIHTTSFGLRAIARCLRSSREPLSDPRYFAIQREVLSSVNELGSRSFTDVVFWLRTALQVDPKNLVEISDRLKETIRLKAQELSTAYRLSNRQLVSLLLDLAQIGVDNTIFLESRLIDRLSDPSELFNYNDYSQTLTFLAAKRHRISRPLFEKTADRMLQCPADDVMEEIRSLRDLRRIRLQFTWPKLKELHEYLNERIAGKVNMMSDTEARNLIAGMSDNPRAEVGVENALFAWLQRRWVREDRAAEICNDLRHVTKYGTLNPERVPNVLIDIGVKRLGELLQTQKLSLLSLEKLLFALKFWKPNLSHPFLSAVSASVQSCNDPFTTLQFSSLTGEIIADTTSAVQTLQKSVGNSIPMRRMISILRYVATHPKLTQSPMLLSFESHLLSQLRSTSQEQLSHFLLSFVDILESGWVPKADLERVFPNILEAIEKDFPTLRRSVCYSIMCMALENHPDSVRRILEKHKEHLAKNGDIDTWVRMTSHSFDFESYIAFLSLLGFCISARGVINTLRFYTPSASSTSIIQFCSLLDKAPGQLLGESFFAFHAHTVVGIIEAFPALTGTLRKRLAKELELIPPGQRYRVMFLDIYLALKRIGDVQLPSLDHGSIKQRAEETTAPQILRLLLSEKPHLADFTLAQKVVSLNPHLHTHQMQNHFLALAEFGEKTTNDQWQRVCEEFLQRTSTCPINTAAEMLGIVAPIAHPKLNAMKQACFLDILGRIRTSEYPSTDTFVNLLPSLRYIHSIPASDVSYVCSSAAGQFPLLSIKEKARCISSLGAVGYSDMSPYTATIEKIQHNEAEMLKYAPELLQGIHLANLISTPLFTSFTNKYCELTHGTKRINTIDFSRVSLAVCRLSPGWRTVLKEHYQTRWGDMSPLRQYLLSLALDTDTESTNPRIAGLLSQALPSPVLSVLKRYQRDVKVKTLRDGFVAPFYLPHCDTVLWSPWAEHQLTYTKEINGDLQLYVQAGSRRVKKVLGVPQSLADEQQAKEWLETNSII